MSAWRRAGTGERQPSTYAACGPTWEAHRKNGSGSAAQRSISRVVSSRTMSATYFSP